MRKVLREEKIAEELVEIFYMRDSLPEIINITFTINIEAIDDEKRTFSGTLAPHGDRWTVREIDGVKGLYDKVSGDFMSYDVIVKSFEEAKAKHGGMTINYRGADWNENVGANNIHGLKVLLENDKIEQAFLSCHGLVRHKMRVFAYIVKYGFKYAKEDYEGIKKDFKNTGPLIDYVCKNMRSLSNLKDRLKGYNKDRNEIDHELTEGRIDRRRIIDNIRCGISLLEELDNAFQKEFLSTTSG